MQNNIPSLRIILPCLFLFLIAGAFPAQGRAGETGKLDIVTTLFPQYDFARIIGGEKVAVKILLPAGSDPHAFDPKPSDMEAIATADIFAYTGADMEPWAEKVIEAMKDSGTARAVDLSAGMRFLRSSELAEDEGGEHHEGEEHEEHDAHGEDEHEEHGHAHVLDPHVWLDPVLALAMTDTLLAAMCEVDPGNAAYYTANAVPLRNELRAIDAECREMIAGAKRRTLVFGGRFAFAYFAERYGLEHIGAYDSCGAGAEPSIRRVMEITEYVEKNAIPVIFHEEGVEPRISRGIADATGCKTRVAHSLHNLSAAELESGITFVELMRRNVAALSEGLQ